jgi:hypothetical protein
MTARGVETTWASYYYFLITMYRRVLTKSTSLKQAGAPCSKGKRRAKNNGIASKISITSEIKSIKRA